MPTGDVSPVPIDRAPNDADDLLDCFPMVKLVEPLNFALESAGSEEQE